jgi:hypothetical protein
MLLAEHWNGSTWALQALSLPPGASGSLAGVSCRSAANCTAVGQYQSNTAGGVLAEAWNGSTWTMQATPSPTGAIDSQLNAISCPSASSCTAAGLYSTTSSTFPLAETWNGSTWTIQATPSPAGATAGSYLSSLSCTSAGNCTAVGQYDKKLGPVFPLAEHWNGSTWAIQTTPVPTGAASSQLNAVACNSGCTAVGTYSPSQTANLTLAEHK